MQDESCWLSALFNGHARAICQRALWKYLKKFPSQNMARLLKAVKSFHALGEKRWQGLCDTVWLCVGWTVAGLEASQNEVMENEEACCLFCLYPFWAKFLLDMLLIQKPLLCIQHPLPSNSSIYTIFERYCLNANEFMCVLFNQGSPLTYESLFKGSSDNLSILCWYTYTILYSVGSLSTVCLSPFILVCGLTALPLVLGLWLVLLYPCSTWSHGNSMQQLECY